MWKFLKDSLQLIYRNKLAFALAPLPLQTQRTRELPDWATQAFSVSITGGVQDAFDDSENVRYFMAECFADDKGRVEFGKNSTGIVVYSQNRFATREELARLDPLEKKQVLDMQNKQKLQQAEVGKGLALVGVDQLGLWYEESKELSAANGSGVNPFQEAVDVE